MKKYKNFFKEFETNTYSILVNSFDIEKHIADVYAKKLTKMSFHDKNKLKKN